MKGVLRLVVGWGLAVGVLLPGGPVAAQSALRPVPPALVAAHAHPPAPPGHHVLVADTSVADTRVVRPARFGKTLGPRTATINVTYVGFPAEARQAFAYAVDLWERHISSPVPINIRARWEPLPERTLGSAGPTTFFANEGALETGTWYPVALAELLLGRSLNGSEADIVASFNSTFDFNNDGVIDWYFGTDARPSSTQYDLVTVVLHEIGHGLGFIGSFDYDDGVEASDNGDECPSVGAGFGCWGLRSSSGNLFPIIFDRFAEDAAERALLNTAVYPNPSQALGAVLQSDDVFFDGETTRGFYDDTPIDLYAPSNFEPGSSFSHLDERTFPPGTPNSLMTPQLARREAIHTPGGATCAIFQDLGWRLGEECLAFLTGAVGAFVARAEDDQVVLTWQLAAGSQVNTIEVQQLRADGTFATIATLAGPGAIAEPQPFSYVVDDLAPGLYTFRLRLVGAGGAASLSQRVEAFIAIDGPFLLTGVYPNPARGAAQIELYVSDEQAVTAALYDAVGRRVAVLFEGRVSPQQRVLLPVPAARLAAGVYFVVAEGQRFRATRQFVVLP